MKPIDKFTESKIKASARIEDVLEDSGVVLRPRNGMLVGLCPFHEDRSIGSFVVNTRDNYCKCFACGEKADALDALMRLRFPHLGVKEAYPQALRWLAAKYGIYIDDEPVPEVKRAIPRIPPAPKQVHMWSASIIAPFRKTEAKNPLVEYLGTLPLNEQHRHRLQNALRNYGVTTYHQGHMQGAAMWWYIDELGYVRTCKLMKYKADGHRDKEINPIWMHAMMAKAGTFDRDKYRVDICLYGQHLLGLVELKDAVVRVVESEKTAVICSAFTEPRKVIWLATGGKSGLSGVKFDVMMRQGRRIELYPDYDGYGDWEKIVQEDAKLRDYPHLTISDVVRTNWTEADGPKADIADIMIRLVTSPPPNEYDATYQMAKVELGLTEDHAGLKYLINKMQLTL